MSKQDRGTAITITLVLIICTVTLVAVGSFLWQLISPAFGVVGSVMGLQINNATGNYNFAVEYEHANLVDPAIEPIITENTIELIEEVKELPEDNEQESPDTDIEVTEELPGDSGIDYNFHLPAKN